MEHEQLYIDGMTLYKLSEEDRELFEKKSGD